ncbi:hypothetical protein K505DRAFT_399422 [Melanomma pulvis-pyrius CBS 109.77]|uniref:Uncharacterized protein n=1 Tax=Melanomma pulvis-pyrius CBS 109.77 TaxID=1314802 RepID=A0A6A6WQV3_9PLEO|nr:hypothetical protein K505DRAFT_399422 [Melanomma pulvis-pyrius CBS 109.77]
MAHITYATAVPDAPEATHTDDDSKPTTKTDEVFYKTAAETSSPSSADDVVVGLPSKILRLPNPLVAVTSSLAPPGIPQDKDNKRPFRYATLLEGSYIPLYWTPSSKLDRPTWRYGSSEENGGMWAGAENQKRTPSAEEITVSSHYSKATKVPRTPTATTASISPDREKDGGKKVIGGGKKSGKKIGGSGEVSTTISRYSQPSPPGWSKIWWAKPVPKPQRGKRALESPSTAAAVTPTPTPTAMKIPQNIGTTGPLSLNMKKDGGRGQSSAAIRRHSLPVLWRWFRRWWDPPSQPTAGAQKDGGTLEPDVKIHYIQ